MPQKTRKEVREEIKRLQEHLEELPPDPPDELYFVIYKSTRHMETIHASLASAQTEANQYSTLVYGIFKFVRASNENFYIPSTQTV